VGYHSQIIIIILKKYPCHCHNYIIVHQCTFMSYLICCTAIQFNFAIIFFFPSRLNKHMYNMYNVMYIIYFQNRSTWHSNLFTENLRFNSGKVKLKLLNTPGIYPAVVWFWIIKISNKPVIFSHGSNLMLFWYLIQVEQW